MLNPTLAKTRSRVAVAHRQRDDRAISEATRDHAAAKLEDFIQKTVESAPPLTPAQRARLASLLSGGDAA